MAHRGQGPRGWIGVDLDGTLAEYDGWVAVDHIGDPIKPMQNRVLRWLREGKNVKIMTARVSVGKQAAQATIAIEKWCEKHLGQILPITCKKDLAMIELWDDRAIQVEFNTGRVKSDQWIDVPVDEPA